MTTAGFRRALFVALLAMLAQALLPTLSLARIAAAGELDWIEICTAQGLRRIAVSKTTGEDSSSHVGKHLEHCAFCPGCGLPAVSMPVAQASLVQAGRQNAWDLAKLSQAQSLPLILPEHARARAPPALR